MPGKKANSFHSSLIGHSLKTTGEGPMDCENMQ